MITIASAKNSDYEDFLDIFGIVEEQHRLALPRKYTKPDILFTQEEYQHLIKQKKHQIFMAKSGEESVWILLAEIKYAPNKPTLKKRMYVDIDTICIRPEWRGRGIGKMLLETIEIWTKEKWVHDIQLNVWSFNQEALEFYEKNEYIIVSSLMRKHLS